MPNKNFRSTLPVVREERLPMYPNNEEVAQPIIPIAEKEKKSVVGIVDKPLKRAMTMALQEIGPMANRIMKMASHIGVMADRIGEMANRIVHTEHLIVSTAVLIVDFGLLIDAAIRNFTHSFLFGMSIAFKRDFNPAMVSNKHLDVIGDNIRQILSQQHEFSLKMLESQKEMRASTMQTFDKGVQEK